MTEPALEMIARLQAQPETATAYLGCDCPDIQGALDDLDQPWRETMRTVNADGRVVAAAVIEWDEEVDIGWVYGPWLDCPPVDAVRLLADLTEQAPVSQH